MKPVLTAQLYTVREFTRTTADLAATLPKIRDMGYRFVQISAIGAIPDAEVKSILDSVGLTVCITHVRALWPWQDLDSIIAQHHLWNCGHVAIGAMKERRGIPMLCRRSERDRPPVESIGPHLQLPQSQL
jgi:hypothetical protein